MRAAADRRPGRVRSNGHLPTPFQDARIDAALNQAGFTRDRWHPGC
jgi:hypothetical protein